MLVFSTLFGINTATLIYTLKHIGYKNIPKKSGTGGVLFAIVGGGCVACGTSFLAPPLITLGVTVSTVLRDISFFLTWVASFFLIYSIYKHGLLLATEKVKSLDKV